MNKFSSCKKKYIFSAVSVSVFFILFSIVIFAAINNMKTANLINTIKPAKTLVEIEENFDGTTKRDVKVTNTGSTEYPYGPELYVRIKLLPYWYDQVQDRVVGKTAWTPDFLPPNDWAEYNGYYYY